MDISPAAAKRIIDAINFKLWEAGFTGNKAVKAVAVSVATAVRRIVLEDIHKPLALPKEKP